MTYIPDFRPRPARVQVESMCSEVVDEHEHYGLIVELSESGVRLQRPLKGRRPGRIIQLEFEMPGVDEIIWAKGEICFDQLWRARTVAQGGLQSLLRTSGVRLVTAASRHLRMLRDYVMSMREDEPHWALSHAAHWRG